MVKYVAFLRGINLGNRRPPMSRLKELFEELKFKHVATFIASGNVLFSSAAKDAGRLEARISKHLQSSLGYQVDTFVRTAEEVVKAAEAKAFKDQDREGVTIHIGFLQRPFSPDVAKKLESIRTGDDEFRVLGREFYWLCRIRTSDSIVWKLPEVKALKLPTMTLRNRTSVRKLIAKHLKD